jgi:Flp pilus assembly protein TadD/ferredoxin
MTVMAEAGSSTTVSTPVAEPGEIVPRPKKYARWRAATLASVYVLMGVHIAHWRINGKTLAPLELNELMYTLELGIITAGFIFMVVAIVSAALVGRFFCSWGCHILALEDLSTWLLKKVGIKPRPVRSRLLLLVPPAVLFYMFFWPQILRVSAGEPLPQWRIVYDAEGWTSFTTTDFWRNLPGPWVIAITFLICGFAIVYFLGSRSFCRYACPYGAVFGLFDRISPGRIVAGDDCTQCGTCTSVCQSDVRVHEELKTFGAVVNPACLKDLDCVSVCPNEAVHFGFTKPSLFKSWKSPGRRPYRYDFSIGEELLIAFVFLATLFIFRGLYHTVPFLMTLGFGVILSYLAVVCIRLRRRTRVRLVGIDLKVSNRLTRAGAVYAVVALLFAVFTVHSAFIRYHEFKGNRAYGNFVVAARSTSVEPGSPIVADALRHLEITDRWGVYRPALRARRLATLHMMTGQPEQAEPYLEWLRGIDPAEVHELVADVRSNQGDLATAVKEYRRALALDENRFVSRMALAELLAHEGAFAEATDHLEAAVSIEPDSARAHYNLGVMLARLDRETEAIRHYRAAASLRPRDPQVHNNLGLLLARRGESDAAAEEFRTAIDLHPDFAHPHFNLGQLLMVQGRPAEAAEQFRIAARLDPAYARALKDPAFGNLSQAP